MFYIGPMPDPAPAALPAKAAQVEPAIISHSRYGAFPVTGCAP